MAESESQVSADDTRTGFVDQVVWYYTKARRQLPYIGTDSSGAKIPGGPYTILQPIAAVLVGGLAWISRPVWAASLSWLVSTAAVIVVALVAGYFSGMIDITEQNPIYTVVGVIERLSADAGGTLGGVPIHPKTHRPTQKLAIRCATPTSRPEPEPSTALSSTPSTADEPTTGRSTTDLPAPAAADPVPDPIVVPSSTRTADTRRRNRSRQPAATSAVSPAAATAMSSLASVGAASTRVSGLESLLAASARAQSAGPAPVIPPNKREPRIR